MFKCPNRDIVTFVHKNEWFINYDPLIYYLFVTTPFLQKNIYLGVFKVNHEENYYIYLSRF